MQAHLEFLREKKMLGRFTEANLQDIVLAMLGERVADPSLRGQVVGFFAEIGEASPPKPAVCLSWIS